VTPAERRASRRRTVRFTTAGVIAWALVVACLVGWVVWPRTTSSASPDDRLRVVTTTNFLTDTVRQVGGADVEVVGLMGPGVDPHLYRPKASDLALLRSADLVVAVGLYLEGNMQTVLDDLARTQPVLLAGERIPDDRLLAPPAGAAPEEEHDPHIWFDVSLWSAVVEAVRAGLVEHDPAGADGYRDRAARYTGELEALDREVRRRIATIPAQRRVLVTSHDAFRYFGRAYDIDVVGIQGISTADEATTGDVERVAATVAQRGVRSVFVESSVSGQTLQAVIAAARSLGSDSDIGVGVGGELFSDAAGAAGTREGTYAGMLRANTDRIVAGLR